ncbi:MAG: hypothetical protein JWP63_2759 [Candidatus Solibacter sp.]|nr:hypothetical protein [Candidatus Solibacter sp.]
MRKKLVIRLAFGMAVMIFLSKSLVTVLNEYADSTPPSQETITIFGCRHVLSAVSSGLLEREKRCPQASGASSCPSRRGGEGYNRQSYTDCRGRWPLQVAVDRARRQVCREQRQELQDWLRCDLCNSLCRVEHRVSEVRQWAWEDEGSDGVLFRCRSRNRHFLPLLSDENIPSAAHPLSAAPGESLT